MMQRKHLVIGGAVLGIVLVGARILGGNDRNDSGSPKAAGGPNVPAAPSRQMPRSPSSPSTPSSTSSTPSTPISLPSAPAGTTGQPSPPAPAPAPAPAGSGPADPRNTAGDVQGERQHADMLVIELERQDHNPILADAAADLRRRMTAADARMRSRDLRAASEAYREIAADGQRWLSRQSTLDQLVVAQADARTARDEAMSAGVPDDDAGWVSGETARVAANEAVQTERFAEALPPYHDAARQFRNATVDLLFGLAVDAAERAETSLTAVSYCRRILEINPDHSDARQLLESARSAVSFQNDLGMEFVLIPAGEFMMGSPQGQIHGGGDETFHPVRIEQPFYVQATEVTQNQWEAVMGYNPSAEIGPELPVQNVTWEMAVEYCRRLSERTGHSYRLPTEAEWEYACRAGTRSPWSSDNVAAVSWHRNNAGGRIQRVGILAPNAWDLHDMHGNVSEWVIDTYASYPGLGQLRIDPVAQPNRPADSRTQRIHRGGAALSQAQDVRSARRHKHPQGRTGPGIGFRVVIELEPTA